MRDALWDLAQQLRDTQKERVRGWRGHALGPLKWEEAVHRSAVHLSIHPRPAETLEGPFGSLGPSVFTLSFLWPEK